MRSASSCALFDPTGRKELARLDLPECTDEVWHGYLPNAHPGTVYGFRADGPYQRSKAIASIRPSCCWTRTRASWSVISAGPTRCSATRAFEPRRPVDGPPRLGARDAEGGGRRRGVRLGTDRRPNVPWRNTVIYEAHVRGASMRRAGLRAPGAARSLARASGVRRSPAVDRRDDRRAAARACVPPAARS
jgi:glycogen operon protein